MLQPSRSDLLCLDEVARSLHDDSVGPEEWHDHLFHTLEALFPLHDLAFGELVLQTGTWDAGNHRQWPEFGHAVERYLEIFVEYQALRLTPERTRGEPVMMLDFLTEEQYHGSELYRDIWRELGYESSLMVACEVDGRVLTLALHRSPVEGAFSERDRTLLQRVFPHIIAATKHMQVAQALRTPPRPDAIAEQLHLTRREAEVLAWAARGKANSEIAAILTVSPLTVKTHMQRILDHLGAENRTAAVLAALRCHPHLGPLYRAAPAAEGKVCVQGR